MIGGAAAQNIFYSAPSNPVNLNNNADIEFSKIRVRFLSLIFHNHGCRCTG